jgi:nicotinamidase-related amidase
MEQNTALLVMDMQTSILGNLPNSTPVISKVVKAIAAARKKEIPIIYVTVGFRKNAPEISASNKSFSASKQRFTSVSPEQWLQIHPDVAPRANDLVVTKRRISAFTGSDLEVVLRAQHIQHLVLTGVATSGVVLSTIREAADKDYRLTVLSDACADSDEEIHRVLTTKVFPRQAEVVTVEEWSHL